MPDLESITKAVAKSIDFDIRVQFIGKRLTATLPVLQALAYG
jgi:hypothetical protein